MIMSDPLLQLVCATLVLLVPCGIVLVAPRSPLRLRAAIAAAVIASTASVVIDVVSSSVDLAAVVFDAAGAAAFAASVAILATPQHGARAAGVIASLWAVLVYQPVFGAVVSAVPSTVQLVFGAVDFAAVLATHVSAATVLAVLSWRTGRAEQAARAQESIPIPRGVLAVALLVAGGTAWMLGLERVLSESSGRIVLNSVGGLALGVVVWLLVAQIAGRRSRPDGMVVGLVMAWGALGTGVAFLSPAALIASVVLGVASGAAVVVRARERANRARRFAIGTVIAVVAGGTVLAILADGFGMAATGSVALIAGQLGAVIGVIVYSIVIAFGMWACLAVVDALTPRLGPSRVR